MSGTGERIRTRIKALALTPDETWTLFCLLSGYAPDALNDCLDEIEEGRAPRGREDYRFFTTTGGLTVPNSDGLYGKFRVARVDGRDQPGGDKSGARYFVLDYVHDENARAALMFYADLCEDDLPALAADLRSHLESTVTRPKIDKHRDCRHRHGSCDEPTKGS
jgi:hypothetical protein